MIRNKAQLYNQILLIEDDAPLAFVIRRKLEQLGYSVRVALDGRVGLEQALSNKYVLLIVDVALPEVNGLKILERVRETGMKVPAIIITNQVTMDNELETFKKGGNIFHRKPINFELLETQIKSLLAYFTPAPVITLGDLYLEPKKHLVRKGKHELMLSPKEYEVLILLVSARGEVLSRDDLLNLTFKGVRDVEEGSIDTLVSRLRKKLGSYRGDQTIETVRGAGFRLNLRYLNS